MVCPSDRVRESWRREALLDYMAETMPRSMAERYDTFHKVWAQAFGAALEQITFPEDQEGK